MTRLFPDYILLILGYSRYGDRGGGRCVNTSFAYMCGVGGTNFMHFFCSGVVAEVVVAVVVVVAVDVVEEEAVDEEEVMVKLRCTGFENVTAIRMCCR